MSNHFPTFARWIEKLGLPLLSWPWWLSSPWWPADSLAAKQQTALRLLATAASERLDYAPLVKALASEQRGRYRMRLVRLARRLESGTPLPDALEQTRGVLTDEQTLAVRFGTQSGVLPQALAALVERQELVAASAGQRLRQVKTYATTTAIVFLLVVNFLMIKIVPQFEKIMQDFAMEVSDPLEWLISVSNTAIAYAVPIAFGAVLGLWVVKSERSRQFFRHHVFSRLLRPVTHLRSAGLLELLAVAQQAGRPLAGSLSTLARYHYDSAVRHKLLYVRNEVEQGGDCWESMQRADLLTAPEANALSRASSSEAQVWTYRTLADWKQSRIARRFDTFVDFLFPAVILLMAAVVLWVALATLTPLYDLIDGLS